MMASLSVVIPALNAAETIRANLTSVLRNDYPSDKYEILVVCDGSTDRTLRMVSEFPIKIVECHEKGIGLARNFGIAEAKHDIVCFIDSDCVVPRDHLQKISSYFDSHTIVDGIGGPVLPFIYEGINDWSIFIEEIYAEACDFPKKDVAIGPREEVWTHTLKGPNMAFRKSALLSVNGFEKRMHGEDIEICWRMVENRKVLHFLSDLKVFQYIPGDLRRIFQHSFRWGMDCKALRLKYPDNPLTLFSENRKHLKKEQRNLVGKLFDLASQIESAGALLTVASILSSIAFEPMYNDRKKAFLRAYMLAAFYLGYFHTPKSHIHFDELGSFNVREGETIQRRAEVDEILLE